METYGTEVETHGFLKLVGWIPESGCMSMSVYSSPRYIRQSLPFHPTPQAESLQVRDRGHKPGTHCSLSFSGSCPAASVSTQSFTWNNSTSETGCGRYLPPHPHRKGSFCLRRQPLSLSCFRSSTPETAYLPGPS